MNFIKTYRNPKRDGTKDYHILIVEDDVCLKTILDRVLRSIDPNVSYSWTTSAEEALGILSEVKVDLVIADHTLEGVKTGIDLWEECQKKYPDLPYLMISGLEMKRFFEMVGKKKNSPPFMPKPLRVRECRFMLEGILDSRKNLRESF